MLTTKELREIFHSHQYRPRKSLGQSFLVDDAIRAKILDSSDLQREDIVVEIGPGFGALTFDLADRVKKVIAVEKDRTISPILGEMIRESKRSNIELVKGDILGFPLEGIARDRLKVLGNLPYSITTPIILYLIENKDLIGSIFITLQREFAQRLLAKPDTSDFGSISCFVQYHTRCSSLFAINRGSFFPLPKVDSSFIRLDVLGKPSVIVKEEEIFFKVIRASFNQRRKMIANSLSNAGIAGLSKGELVLILNRLNIDGRKRAENLSLNDFANIANALAG